MIHAGLPRPERYYCHAPEKRDQSFGFAPARVGKDGEWNMEVRNQFHNGLELGVEGGLTTGQLDTGEAQVFALFHDGLEQIHRENGIGTVSCLELGCYPAMAAGEIAAFGEVEVDLVEGVFFFNLVHSGSLTAEAQSSQRKRYFSNCR